MSRKKGRGLMHNEHGWGDDYTEYFGQGRHAEYKVKKGWDTGDAPQVCENCDWLPKTQKQQICIDYPVWKALMGISAKVKVEWQALLTGEISPDGIVHIHGYFIPKQEVTSSTVKNLDLIDDVVIAERGIVAGVHSHGNMACFFSSTDMEDTNMSLIKHNIVVNNQTHYKAQSRVDLPCGLVKFVDAEVSTVGEPMSDIVGIENITEKTYGFVTKTEKSAPYTPWGARHIEIEGLRWCPTCSFSPEEDSGASCICWTKGYRPMLPDFTTENYVLQNDKRWELKPNLLDKYGGSRKS